MESERHEGGSPRGVYTTQQKAEDERPENWGITLYTIVPVEVDAPQAYLPTLLRDGKTLV